MDLGYAVYSFVALFIIVDPVINVPLFLSLLENFSRESRQAMIKKSVLIAFVVLIIFTLLGNYIFKFLGIGIYSFKIAGGILLSIISFEMLFGRQSRTESTDEEKDEVKLKEDLTVTPMAVPLLTGPGAITTGVVLFNAAKSPADQAVLLLNILFVFILSYIILAKSEYIFKLLGSTGTKVIVRLMGLMLLAISVQFIITGIFEAVKVLGKV